VSHLACSHAYRGAARVRAGQVARAAADLRRAVELWTKVPHLQASLDSSWFELPQALAVLAGLGKDAKSGVTAAEAATIADQAVAALRNASKAGRVQLDELKQSDFDPLRGHSDFQKLGAELEARHKAEAATDKDSGTK
jgi:hypothetical protein